jgi:hypothetical protein
MNPESPIDLDSQSSNQPGQANNLSQNLTAKVESEGVSWAAIVAVVTAAVSFLILLPFVFYNLMAANDSSVAPFGYAFFVLGPVAVITVPATAIASMVMAAIAKPNASRRTKVMIYIAQGIITLDALAIFLIFYN